MPVVDELIGLLGFRIQGEGNLARFKRGMNEAEQSARKSAGGVKAAFIPIEKGADRSAFAVGRIGAAAAAGGVAMVGLATKGVKEFAAFERQMSRIGITANATTQETEGAGKVVQDLANRYRLPLDQAITGLDTLVSSGMNLKQAMDFLPSVLMTAQAAGAATDDIANTAQKTASALGIQADKMQNAFDIMVTGGKAGQFELKDMAQFIPSLASEFATLGYKGEDGLKRLIAMLQALRTRTGTAGEAATQASNIFGKMFSEQTAKNFKDFGINLRKEMDAAKKSGTDALTAFVQLSEKALKGDMTKLPLLFQDAELRKGMTTLIQARGEWKGFLDEVSSSKVDGSTLQDFNKIAGDTASSIQQMSNSWDQMLKSIGGGVAPSASAAMDAITAGIEKTKQAEAIRKKRGDSLLGRVFGPAWETADEVIAKDREERRRSGTAYLRQDAKKEAETPAVLKTAERKPKLSPMFGPPVSAGVTGGWGDDQPDRSPSFAPSPKPYRGGLNRPERLPFVPSPTPKVGASGSWAPSAASRVSGAFDAFPSAPAKPQVDTSGIERAKQMLDGIDGMSATAKFIADVSSFLDPASQAQKIAMDLNTSVTTRFTADISDLEAKAARAQTLVNNIRSASAGIGSTGRAAPTPAREAGAGAAP